MPNTFYIKQGDLLPVIRSTLYDANGDPIDLTGANVTFVMRLPGAPNLQVRAGATIVDPVGGVVQYAWQEGDTNVVGGFAAEWSASIGGQQMTIPNLNYLTVQVSNNLQTGVGPPPPPPPLSPPISYVSQLLVVTSPKASDGVSVNATGIAANAPGNAMTGPFSNPDVPRTLRVAFGLGWDGGAVTLNGLDQFGNPISATVAANPGGFTDSTQVFSSVTSASKAAVGASAAVATLGLGAGLGILAVLANANAMVSADNIQEGATIDAVNNSFTPETPPDGSVTYALLVNVK